MKLKGRIGGVGVVALGVGAAVGASIFAALGPATAMAGPAVVIALVVAAAPMAVFAMIYAALGAAAPASGASYVWTRAYVHPFVAFMLGWLRVAGLAAALIVLAHALVQYLGVAAPVASPLPVVAAALATVWLLNTISAAIAVRAQVMMALALLVSVLVLAVRAAPQIGAMAVTPFAPHGVGGVLAAAGLLAGLFFGVETATEMGEEARAAGPGLRVLLLITLGVTLAIYLVIAIAALGVLGPAAVIASPALLPQLAQRVLGPAGTWLAAIIGAAAIGAAMNALFMVLARTLTAMGRSGVLPKALARVHERRGTPWIATTASLALCLGGLLLPAELVLLLLAVSLAGLLRYGLIAIAALRAMSRDDEMCARAGLSMLWTRILCWSGVVLAVGLIALGGFADWRPYAALGAWASIGAGYYLLRHAWFRPAAG